MDFQEAHYFLYTKDCIVKAEQRNSLEVMRLQTFYLIQPHITKKANINKPSDLIPFHWDNITPIEPLQVDEESFQAFDRMFSNRKKRLSN